MTWTQKPIPAPLLAEIESIANTVSSVTEPVVDALDLATTALEAARSFLTVTANPTTAIANQVITELENLNNDIFGTGVFQLVVQPFDLVVREPIPGIGTPSTVDTDSRLLEIAQTGATLAPDAFGITKLSPQRNIQKIVDSFSDEGDSERPQFSDSAQVVAFGMMITAPTVGDFNGILENFLSVWDLGDFRNLLNRLKAQTNADTGGITPTPSQAPDWDSVRFNSITFLKDTQDQINKQIGLMRGFIGSTDDIVGDFLDLVQRKIDNLQFAVQEFNQLIATIKNTAAASGVYFLDVPPGIGGNTRLIEEIQQHDFALSRDQISASIVYVGGGASLAPVDAIRTLLA